jgi:hypothetical protein
MNDAEVADERALNDSTDRQPNSTLAETDYLMQRLNDRIAWYDRSAIRSQRCFKTGRVFILLAAAAIPLGSAFSATVVGSSDQATLIAGLLGAAIVVVEGIQQLFQWQQNWVSYRSTCEALQRERSLYLAQAGSYRRERAPRMLLAERIEAIMGNEHVEWLALNEQSGTRRSDGAETPVQRPGF